MKIFLKKVKIVLDDHFCSRYNTKLCRSIYRLLGVFLFINNITKGEHYEILKYNT